MRRAAALLLLAVLSGCGDGGEKVDPQKAVEPEASAAGTTAPLDEEPSVESNPEAWQACAKRVEQVKAEPALAGAPDFEKVRVHMARVRGRSLYFKQSWPRPASLQRVLDENDTADKVAPAVRNLINKTKDRKARRAMLLRDGYLWDSDVRMALALVEQVSLPNLFEEQKLYVQRGADIYELTRVKKSRFKKERYLYKDGPLAGEQAEILLGDRVATSREELGDDSAQAIDLADLATRERFDRIKPVHLTDKAMVAELRYGPDHWVPAVIDLKGPRADVACEVLSDELAGVRAKFVAETDLLRAALKRVKETIRQMVREEIPFDADTGQSMGFLREEWKRAYFHGKRRFDYEGELRLVYNEEGAPVPPQVCIDFLTDVWERASGTWYAPADKVEGNKKGKFKLEAHPKRLKGAIDFDSIGVANRRSVAEFAKFTKEHEDLFDLWELPSAERVPFLERDRFFEYLAAKSDMFRPGDMITLHGYKEGGRPHYHSLIVLETDPITGVISRIAGNAVFPREQTLEGIMYISPKRSIRHRIRVKEPWLKLVAGVPDEPLGG
jgi:hypothetical protein